MSEQRCENCRDVLDHDPHRPGAGPQRHLCTECGRRVRAADAVHGESWSQYSRTADR